MWKKNKNKMSYALTTSPARNCRGLQCAKLRELELKYLRDLGVYEKVVKKEAVAKYGITPADTKRVDTDKAIEEEPMQISSRMCAREFKSNDRPDPYAGTPPLEALKAIISIAANRKETFSIMHIDVSRAHFHAKAQRPVLIRLPVEDRRWESRIDEEEHVRNEGRGQQLGT